MKRGPEEKLHASLWSRISMLQVVTIAMIAIVAALGLVLLVLNIISLSRSARELSATCDDNNGATYDYLTQDGCENIYIGDDVACTDACIVATTGRSTMDGNTPKCSGTCVGACVSLVNATANYYYYPMVNESCPEIEWSPMMLANNSGLIGSPTCLMNFCMYFVQWPDQISPIYLAMSSNLPAMEELCLGLVDTEYALRNCLLPLPAVSGCTFVFSCTQFSTQPLAGVMIPVL